MSNLQKITTLTLMVILLASCRSTASNSLISQQCSPVFTYVELAGKTYIDVDESKCYCRNHKLSKEYIGSVGGDIVKSLDYCNKIVGYKPKVYSEVMTFLEWVRMQINIAPTE